MVQVPKRGDVYIQSFNFFTITDLIFPYIKVMHQDTGRIYDILASEFLTNYQPYTATEIIAVPVSTKASAGRCYRHGDRLVYVEQKRSLSDYDELHVRKPTDVEQKVFEEHGA